MAKTPLEVGLLAKAPKDEDPWWIVNPGLPKHQNSQAWTHCRKLVLSMARLERRVIIRWLRFPTQTRRLECASVPRRRSSAPARAQGRTLHPRTTGNGVDGVDGADGSQASSPEVASWSATLRTHCTVKR